MAGKYEEIVRCSFCNKPQSQVRKTDRRTKWGVYL